MSPIYRTGKKIAAVLLSAAICAAAGFSAAAAEDPSVSGTMCPAAETEIAVEAPDSPQYEADGPAEVMEPPQPAEDADAADIPEEQETADEPPEEDPGSAALQAPSSDLESNEAEAAAAETGHESTDAPDMPYTEHTCSISEGDTLKLGGTCTAEDGTVFTLVWEVPDNGILSVSGNTLTGLAEGYAAATGYAVVNGERYPCERYLVSVCRAVNSFSVKDISVEPGRTASADIVINPASDRLPYGKVPAGTFSVEVSDTSVASVTYSTGMLIGGPNYESYTVKGLKPGKTELVVTYAPTGMTKRAEITVTDTAPEKVRVGNITLNRQGAGLFVGRSFQLRADVVPENASDKRLVWKSSDTMVATVDQTGKISAKRRGTAVITCRAKDGSGVGASCTVTVKLPVKKIELSRKSVSLRKGRSLTLTASVSPRIAWSRSVTWSSGNPSVVSVSSAGKIIAKTPGTAVVTCTAKDGSGVKASCRVTVIGPVVKVSRISLDRTSVGILKGRTLQLKASVAPASASNKAVTWKSSNTGIVTVDSSGKLTAKGKGTATVSCTAKDGSGVKAVCRVTVTVPQQPQGPSGPPYPVGNTVWVSATGSKYHTVNDCGTMDPNRARQVTRAEAESRGLQPCSKCCRQ